MITLRTHRDLRITLNLLCDNQLCNPDIISKNGEFILWKGNRPIKKVVSSVADIPPYSDIPPEIQNLYHNCS
jgi:hypothetical protein